MADDQKPQDEKEDVAGHVFTEEKPEGDRKDTPGVATGFETAEKGEDDVEGHVFSAGNTPQEGRKDAPGVFTD